jgi:hypothetical protein
MKRKHRAPEPNQDVTRSDDSRWLPGWAPYVVFALLAAFLFREFIVSKGILFGTDVLALGYYARHFYAEMVRSGTFPMWNPHIFGGLPFVDAMHGDIFYPTSVLTFVMPVHRAMGWKIVLHIFLAGVFTYGWLRHLSIGRLIALFGGITYMLAPVMVTLVYPGHDGKLFVSALTPLALWVTDWAIARGGVQRFATLAIVVALLIYTAHMQLAYYTVWAIAILAIYRLIEARRTEGTSNGKLAGRFVMFGLAGVIGALGIGAMQLWTPLRYLTKYSQRVEKSIEAEAESAYARATSWSLHPEEAFSLVVPEFVGANLQTQQGPVQTYWGRNPFKLNHEYAGLIPLLLLPLAFLTRRRRGEVWLFTGIAAASLIFALGATTPLFRLFYWLVPGVKLFRAPSSIMFVFAIAVVTVAALGLEGARESKGADDWVEVSPRVSFYLWGAAGFMLLLALLGSAGVLTDLWQATLYPNMAPPKLAALQANLPNIKRGLWLSFLLAGLSAGAWQLMVRGSLPRAGFIAAITLLSALDMFRVNPQYILVVPVAPLYPMDDVTEFLLDKVETEDPFRVYAPPFRGAVHQPNHFAFYGIDELTGHHGNELGRYTDLSQPEVLQADGLKMLRTLNVRYIVAPGPVRGPGIRPAFEGQRASVFEVKLTAPRAFLVGAAEVVPDTLALDRLRAPDLLPWQVAVLEDSLGYPLVPVDRVLPVDTASGTLDISELERNDVRWVERSVNAQTLEVDAEAPSLLVISDNYYPAWRATVDGEAVPVVLADYSFRGVPVPEGTHTVRLEYHSTLFQAAVWTTVLSLLLVVGIILAMFVRGRRTLLEVEPGER